MLLKSRILLQQVINVRHYSKSNKNLYFHPGWSDELQEKFAKSFLIYDDFICESEETKFMSEMEPHLKRHVYEKDHWDDVSVNFASCNHLVLLYFNRLIAFSFSGNTGVQRNRKKIF